MTSLRLVPVHPPLASGHHTSGPARPAVYSAGRPRRVATRVRTPRRRVGRPVGRGTDDRGQSTVEYALLLLGAAAIALVVVAWVTRTDLIGRLFDTVVGRILEQA